ncbi:MAG TPA: PSD1 and planctomycete cytochrome C domain-containing protein [Planctomycetota bacterium]|nr:PSD1 and planctomycete cytochrome C domain-containing protein [Planctomycetota bacterium]
MTVLRLLLCGSLLGFSPAQDPPAVDYVRDLKPLFRERCVSCHGSLKQKGRLRADTVEAMKKKGAIVPGRPDQSPIVQRVTATDDTRMPLDAKALTPKEVDLLRTWIAAGAPGPADEKPEEPPSAHWAFRVPARAAVPAGRNPVDVFVAAERERRGLPTAPPASKEVLLRRVHLDLVGLPPTPEELRAFLADASPDAYEKVVDRLLARPQYGERWGRHWMDVWRYSDWYGTRSQNDVRYSYGQIWRWRDWIVRSLNEDKGYDRMIVEMLAADEVAPEDDAALAATGFIVRNWYGWNHNQWMRDLVEHTGKAFLGLTMNCAHCHDHKYDPITQEDYFRFRAFFEPLQLRHDRVPGEPDPGPFKKYVYEAKTAPMKSGLIRVYDENPDATTTLYSGGDERNKVAGAAPHAPAAPAFLGGRRIAIVPVELPASVVYPGSRPFVREEELARRKAAVAAARKALSEEPLTQARLEAAEADLVAISARTAADEAPGAAAAAARAERLAGLLAAKVRMMEAKEGKEREAAKKAMERARQACESSDAAYTPLSPRFPSRSSGRRTALARWIVSPENPLTARVAVNHVWLRHFGTPLVESVFDFGRNGKAPSHPELLDALAVELMESNWSLKRLHWRIVTSDAYRMSSAAPVVPASDPDNRFYWRFPGLRLEAEAIRDALLYAAGDLDLTMGGPDLDNRSELGSRRRSLYFSHYAEDGGQMKFLELFDAPDPVDAYRRNPSITPQQALALTNSALGIESSRSIVRVIGAVPDADFVRRAFERILSRSPSEAELSLSLAFLKRQAELVSAVRARESLARSLFSHHEFVTIR